MVNFHEGEHMDQMMDFDWTPDLGVFILIGLILLVTLIIILLYFLTHSQTSDVKKEQVEPVKRPKKTTQHSEKKLICPNCGNHIEDEDASYCTFCGAEI
ncbi:MAG: zinc-ribbon domain-containing protein [Promethearchaeia archaeon]